MFSCVELVIQKHVADGGLSLTVIYMKPFFFTFSQIIRIQIAYISDIYNTFIVQAHSISQES